jgi:hypothetical protein
MQDPLTKWSETGVMLIFLLLLAVGLIELALLLFCCRLAENKQKTVSATIEKAGDHLT